MSRGAPGVDPHLDLKIGLFFVAAVLGVGGMLFGTPVPIYVAMVAIGVGLLLRFAARGRRESGPDRGASGSSTDSPAAPPREPPADEESTPGPPASS